MIFQMATQPMRLKVEFFSIYEYVTKDGKTVKETPRKHVMTQALANIRKEELEDELRRQNWEETSGHRFQHNDVQKWFDVQKQIFEIEG